MWQLEAFLVQTWWRVSVCYLGDLDVQAIRGDVCSDIMKPLADRVGICLKDMGSNVPQKTV